MIIIILHPPSTFCVKQHCLEVIVQTSASENNSNEMSENGKKNCMKNETEHKFVSSTSISLTYIFLSIFIVLICILCFYVFFWYEIRFL